VCLAVGRGGEGVGISFKTGDAERMERAQRRVVVGKGRNSGK